jgi:hypothetical protein
MNRFGCVYTEFIEARKIHAVYDSGRLCALAALTPDVLEQNFEPQYCSGCR